jgi:hypothetical protein
MSFTDSAISLFPLALQAIDHNQEGAHYNQQCSGRELEK